MRMIYVFISGHDFSEVLRSCTSECPEDMFIEMPALTQASWYNGHSGPPGLTYTSSYNKCSLKFHFSLKIDLFILLECAWYTAIGLGFFQEKDQYESQRGKLHLFHLPRSENSLQSHFDLYNPSQEFVSLLDGMSNMRFIPQCLTSDQCWTGGKVKRRKSSC